MKICVIGLGLMGRAMAAKLISAGETVVVYNRTKEKAEPILALGAAWADTPAQAASQSDVVISMVSDPVAVEEIALGESGVLGALPAESVHCDMSTVSPRSAKEIARRYRERGKRFVQAPVLGSKRQIEQGALLVFGGGAEEDVRRCEPAWKAFSSRIWQMDSAEEAAGAKLACNLLIGHMILGLGQSLLFAQKCGVAPALVLEILNSSAMSCNMFNSKGEKLLARDFTANFFVRHMLKDLTLASETAQKESLPMPLNALTRELFVAATQKGWADQDYSAAIKVLEDLAGTELT
ncbi:MAG TPA: NAD(P)-dependent oxidoreductase [Capsulimonadaceae bacterium]|nr:NAD(P)-dependent oxidoreductase [Capsulimonadaceae bacterium]